MSGAIHPAAFREAAAKLADAERAMTALDWLKCYGPKGEHKVGRDQISAKINMNFASACAGATEAKAYLEEAAWVSEAGFEVKPTKWMRLPAPPVTGAAA